MGRKYDGATNDVLQQALLEDQDAEGIESIECFIKDDEPRLHIR